jgi:hypothetical protein
MAKLRDSLAMKVRVVPLAELPSCGKDPRLQEAREEAGESKNGEEEKAGRMPAVL